MEKQKVIYQMSNKRHWYKVLSSNCVDYHDVSLKTNCDCWLGANSHLAKKGVCSHVMELLKAIVEKNNIELKSHSSLK
jgi:hypothetical protein